MSQADVFRYAVAGVITLVVLGSVLMYAVAAWRHERTKK